MRNLYMSKEEIENLFLVEKYFYISKLSEEAEQLEKEIKESQRRLRK